MTPPTNIGIFRTKEEFQYRELYKNALLFKAIGEQILKDELDRLLQQSAEDSKICDKQGLLLQFIEQHAKEQSVDFVFIHPTVFPLFRQNIVNNERINTGEQYMKLSINKLNLLKRYARSHEIKRLLNELAHSTIEILKDYKEAISLLVTTSTQCRNTFNTYIMETNNIGVNTYQ